MRALLSGIEVSYLRYITGARFQMSSIPTEMRLDLEPRSKAFR